MPASYHDRRIQTARQSDTAGARVRRGASPSAWHVRHIGPFISDRFLPTDRSGKHRLFRIFPVCIDLAGATDMVTNYTGHVVTGREAVAQTVEFVSRQQIREIRANSKEAALRVRKDYASLRCACAVQAAILETVRKPEAAKA